MVKLRRYGILLFFLLSSIISITSLEYLLRLSVDSMSLSLRLGTMDNQVYNVDGSALRNAQYTRKGEVLYRPEKGNRIENLALFVPNPPDRLSITSGTDHLYSFNSDDIYYNAVPRVIPLGPLMTSGSDNKHNGIKIRYEFQQRANKLFKDTHDYTLFIGSVDRMPSMHSWWLFFKYIAPLISLASSVLIAVLFFVDRSHERENKIFTLPFIIVLSISLYYLLDLIYQPQNNLTDAILLSLAALYLTVFTPLNRNAYILALVVSLMVFVLNTSASFVTFINPHSLSLSTFNAISIISISIFSLVNKDTLKPNIENIISFIAAGLIIQPFISEISNLPGLTWINSTSFAIFIINAHYVLSRWKLMKKQLETVVRKLGPRLYEHDYSFKNKLGDLDIHAILSENERLTEFKSRIHSDLHDGVLTNLSILTMQLKQDKRRSNTQVLEQIQRTSGEVRFIIEATSSGYDVLYAEFASAVMSYIQTYYRSLNTSIKSDINFDNSETLFFPSSRHAIYLFRILQELLSNATVHGNAKEIELTAIYREKKGKHTVQLKVKNEGGTGLNSKPKERDGFGLRNIVSRCDAMGFTIQINPLETGAEVLLGIELVDEVRKNALS